MSAEAGSSSIARLYAATAPATSSFSASRCAIMNCAYASPVLSADAAACVDRGAAVCACAATVGLTAAKATTANHFIRLELFHKSAKVSYIPNMAVDPELLEILACPNCKTPV